MSVTSSSELSRLLGEEGPFATGERYKPREGQRRMAEAVGRALEHDSILLCEAGTGTGKTLAYLLPAVLSGQRVVISTATKALEDQIFEREIPVVERVLGRPVSARVAKGISNYVCLRRTAEFQAEVVAKGDKAISSAKNLAMFDDWLGETDTGDRAEARALSENDPLWDRVLSGRDTRIGSSCKNFERCFVTRLKEDLLRARIIIVNHHLFFADLALKSRSKTAERIGVLPPYDAVIFDEAHRVEDIASLYLGASFQSGRVDSLVRDLRATLRRERLDAATARLLDAVLRDHGAWLAVARTLCGEEGRLVLDGDPAEHPLQHAMRPLLDSLFALESFLETHAVSVDLDGFVRRARECREDIDAVFEPPGGSLVTATKNGESVSLSVRPVHVGHLLEEHLYRRFGAVVFVSATLTSPRRTDRAGKSTEDRESDVPKPSSADPTRSFDFFRDRAGLTDVRDVATRELVVPSPFDYQSNTLFYVPKDLPPVSSPDFIDAAIERARDLIMLSGGGALVLSTSHKMMTALGRGLASAQRKPVCVQGDAPKGALLDEFRKTKDGILVATMGFWEGVDVPGDALRLLIIDKLPFAVPSDPMFVMRSKRIEEAGERPFDAYAVPEALITLKQGIGRLVRSETDAGVVALFDRRILDKAYGRTMHKSLDIGPLTHDLERVRGFYVLKTPDHVVPRSPV